MHYLLETKECENYGGIGLLIKGNSNRSHFDPCQSERQLTHDILEHSYKQIGSPIEDELMAIGGCYYIRYLGNYNKGYRYLELKDFESDICYLLHNLVFEYEYLSDPRQYFTKNKEANSDFDSVIKNGIKLYKSEYENEEYEADLTNLNIKYLKGWICKGYSYTKARYKKYDSYELAYKFKNISKQLESLIKSIEYEGQQFKLNINLQTAKVNYQEFYAEIDY